MLLISPQVESTKTTRVPRDLVLVLDTSGSMSELKMEQAKKALKYCLGAARATATASGSSSFATHRHARYRGQARSRVDKDHLEKAKKWVDDLRAGGGTAIMAGPGRGPATCGPRTPAGRSPSSSSPTASRPSDETNPDKIVKNVAAKNTGNTRIFTFGVGDDVNAAMLDQLADATRAVEHLRPPGRGHRGQGRRACTARSATRC